MSGHRKELFGLQSDKAALSSVCSVDNGNDKANLIFGNNGIMTRTLDHWKEMIKQASMLIDSLQKELLKARARRRAQRIKRPMERLRDRKSRPNRPSLTRSRPKDSRACNRAARAAQHWARRSGAKSKEAIDCCAIHRATSTCMRYREKTLPVLNAFVAVAGPVHLRGVVCQRNDWARQREF